MHVHKRREGKKNRSLSLHSLADASKATTSSVKARVSGDAIATSVAQVNSCWDAAEVKEAKSLARVQLSLSCTEVRVCEGAGGDAVRTR